MGELNGAVANSSVVTFAALDEAHVVHSIVEGVPLLIAQAASYNEVALALAQKVFKRLYEKTEPPLLVDVHITILMRIRDVCNSVVKELTNWILYSDNDVRLSPMHFLVGFAHENPHSASSTSRLPSAC